jgi:hypothetical protein
MVDLEIVGVGFPGGVHREVAPLMRAMLLRSIQAGWVALHDGWCWGYANRPIKTSNGGFTETPSNHSWGLAIDVNAPENPFGGTSHKIPEAMGDFWEAAGFRWGGHYSSTKDWMHFEFMGTPEDARPLAGEGDFADDGDPPERDPGRVLEWADGFRRFFRGEREPAEEGHRKRGWNDAQRTVSEPRA